MGKIKSTSSHLCEGQRNSTLAPVQASPHMARTLPFLTRKESVSESVFRVSFLICQVATVTIGYLRTKGRRMAMDLSIAALYKHRLSMYPGTMG